MGNTCKPMAVSFQCMTKFTTNKKKKKERVMTNFTKWYESGSEIDVNIYIYKGYEYWIWIVSSLSSLLLAS